MAYKIVFLDIDGTIMSKQHIIQESTKEAVLQLKRKGIEVVIATGRPLIHTVDIAKELEIDAMISFNGAHAVRNNETVLAKPMNSEYFSRISDLGKQHKHNILFQTLEHSFLAHYSDKDLPDFLIESKIPPLPMHKLKEEDIILGGNLFLNHESEAHLYENFKGYELAPWTTKSEFAIYDIMSRDVNKGTAIRDYLSHIGLSPEESVAFGDGLNDVDMLSFVGMGVAMGNAQEGLLPYADMKTTSVEENGIYNGLKDLHLI